MTKEQLLAIVEDKYAIFLAESNQVVPDADDVEAAQKELIRATGEVVHFVKDM
jgi:hypothetical protein